jgi:Transposase DDE domain
VLELGEVGEQELYAALDWLVGQQERIEGALARRHLQNGTLVLYDVTSTYFEGRTCPLAKLGYGRDGKRGKLQIVIGLLCTAEGCPVAVEVFEGNTADPATVAAQITKLKQRFRLHHVVMVGDRGMLTSARIEQTLRPAGLDWITALRGPAIRQLAETGRLQFSLFDTRDMAEISSPDYPNERLVVCRNPLLAQERQRKRDELLARSEAVPGNRKMAKHFAPTITDDAFSFARKAEAIASSMVSTCCAPISPPRRSIPRDRAGLQCAVPMVAAPACPHFHPGYQKTVRVGLNHWCRQVGGEEFPQLRGRRRQADPLHDNPGRKCRKQPRRRAWVQQHEHALVRRAADQPPERLTQPQANDAVIETLRIAVREVNPPLAMQDVGPRPGRALEHDEAQRLAWHVHAIAHRIRSQQAALFLGPKDVDQCGVSQGVHVLGVERNASCLQVRGDALVHRAQAADRGEQAQPAAAGREEQRPVRGGQLVEIVRGYVGDDKRPGLCAVVER